MSIIGMVSWSWPQAQSSINIGAPKWWRVPDLNRPVSGPLCTRSRRFSGYEPDETLFLHGGTGCGHNVYML